VAGVSLTFFFHHHGTSPHRIGTRVALPVPLHNRINRVSRADVVATGQIALRLRWDAQVIERDDLAPRQSVGEASAHGDQTTACNKRRAEALATLSRRRENEWPNSTYSGLMKSGAEAL
jgi:hypothetical protein